MSWKLFKPERMNLTITIYAEKMQRMNRFLDLFERSIKKQRLNQGLHKSCTF